MRHHSLGLVCLLVLGMVPDLGAGKTKKRVPNRVPQKKVEAVSTREAVPDDFLTGDMVAPNRVSMGAGAGILNIPDIGVGIGFNLEYAHRYAATLPLYLGIELSGMRWDTHAGPKAQSLFEEPAVDVQNTLALTVYSGLATAYLRYYEKSRVHLTVGLSLGGAFIIESGVTAAASTDVTLVSARFQGMLRLGVEIELDYEFEMAQAGAVRIEPRIGLLGSKAYFAPQLQLVVPF